MLRHCGSLVLFLMLAALSCPGNAAEPTPGSAEETRTRTQVKELVEQLGDSRFRVREQATCALIELGPLAEPIVASHTNQQDPEVSERIGYVLNQLRGVHGEAVEGLTLSAVRVGPRHHKGQAVTFWLTIRNITQEDVYLFRYLWDLKLTEANPDNPSCLQLVPDPTDFNARDFYRLKPGEDRVFLMDADPDEKAVAGCTLNVRLHIAIPGRLRGAAPGASFSANRELISGPVTAPVAEDPPAVPPKAIALIDAYAKKVDGAESALANAPEMADAVRWGLRMAGEDRRWRVFEFACEHPRAELEDALIDFLTRYGARSRDEVAQQMRIKQYAAGLPPLRRWPFYKRMAQALAHDWRALDSFVLSYAASEDTDERGAAAELGTQLHELATVMPEALVFPAWEIFTSPDASRRNEKKAMELVKAGLEIEPANKPLQFTMAALSGDKAGMQQVLDKADTPLNQNDLAYAILMRTPTNSVSPESLIALATKALDKTPENTRHFPCFADTLAGAYAYKGDYTKALELQEKALSHALARFGDMPMMTARAVYYAVLLDAEPEDRPRMALEAPPLKTRKARNSVLARLKTETDPARRTILLELMKACFPNDTEAWKAMEDQPATNRASGQ